MNGSSLLLAEKNRDMARRIKESLQSEGFGVIETSRRASVPVLFRKKRPHLLIISSSWGEEGDGLAMVETLLHHDHRLQVILTAEKSSERLILSALKAGVKDFFKVPFSLAELSASVNRCLRDRSLANLTEFDSEQDSIAQGVAMIGDSPAMQRVKAYIRRAAQTDSAVMITGETGTGKELAAELLHGWSRRSNKSLVCVNCAALPENLVESELFGFERGAFTGAVQASMGKFEQAAGGTIFLDEIGDMSLPAQAKILRVIETKKISRVGGRQEIPLDVRGIAATNRDPEQMMTEKEFRADLYYRLNVGRIHLPPLREHKEDIPRLADHFIGNLNNVFGCQVRGFMDATWEYLMQYDWPGNVRELKNFIESSFIDLSSRHLEYIALPDHLKRRIDVAPQKVLSERERMLAILSATNWNKSKAAARLNWSRMTLYRKLKKFDLSV